MKQILLSVLFILTLSSCLYQDTFKHAWHPFNIKKGDHSFKEDRGGLINIRKPAFKTKGSSLMWAKFTESTFYDKTVLGKDSLDINKLFGLSDCHSLHQDHSARFGWRPYNKDSMEIFAYAYVSGVRVIKSMGYVAPYEQVAYQLRLTGDNYQFAFKDSYLEIKRDKNCSQGVYYRLFPYFGGNLGAPNDMQIWVYEEN